MTEINNKKEIEELCKFFGFDPKVLVEDIPKPKPEPILKFDKNEVLQKAETFELLESKLGKGLPLPTTSKLIIGDNALWKTPLLEKWQEDCQNEIAKAVTERYWIYETQGKYLSPNELVRYSSRFIKEIHMKNQFDMGLSPMGVPYCGYLFLDDIFNQYVWNFTGGDMATRFRGILTDFWETVRERTYEPFNLIVVASANRVYDNEWIQDSKITSRLETIFGQGIVSL